MTQEVNTNRLLLIIAKQQVTIDLMDEKITGLAAQIKQLTEREKDEDTKDN